MAYKCVHCSQIFKDDASELVEGCSNCKSKFFFYIKDDKLQQIIKNKENQPELSEQEKKQIEKDIRDISGIESEDQPVFLDFESIKVIKPGKYLLDIQKLFSSDKPQIYQLENGKYIVDLNLQIGKIKKNSGNKIN